MASREQFEKWAESDGMRVDCWHETTDYIITETRRLWEAWQASREALVVELPDGWFDDRYGEYLATHTQIEQALSAAGIKWK